MKTFVIEILRRLQNKTDLQFSNNQTIIYLIIIYLRINDNFIIVFMIQIFRQKLFCIEFRGIYNEEYLHMFDKTVNPLHNNLKTIICRKNLLKNKNLQLFDYHLRSYNRF